MDRATCVVARGDASVPTVVSNCVRGPFDGGPDAPTGNCAQTWGGARHHVRGMHRFED